MFHCDKGSRSGGVVAGGGDRGGERRGPLLILEEKVQERQTCSGLHNCRPDPVPILPGLGRGVAVGGQRGRDGEWEREENSLIKGGCDAGRNHAIDANPQL